MADLAKRWPPCRSRRCERPCLGGAVTGRQEELIACARTAAHVHGMTLKGGLGPPLLPADLAGKDDAALIDAILHGRPGTPMPPWAFEISAAEAGWLVGQLKEGLADAR